MGVSSFPQTKDEDLLVAGAVILVALVAFISVLYLNRQDRGKKRGSDVDEAAAGGTEFHEENGKIVRRSTRTKRPSNNDDFTAPSSPRSAVKPAAEKPAPKTPRSKKAISAASTPLTTGTLKSPRAGAVDRSLTSPPRARKTVARSAKTPNPKSGASPEPTSPTRRRTTRKSS